MSFEEKYMARGKNTAVVRLLYSSMFLALAMLLPFLIGQIRPFGIALLPMHIPVILCGFICGPSWGMAVGVAAPLLRSIVFGQPTMISAIAMAFELATYAFIAGILYKSLKKNLFMFYIELLTVMVAGRIVWGLVMFVFIILGLASGTIGFGLIWGSTVLNSIPGIILQLIVIPPIINVLKKNRLMLN